MKIKPHLAMHGDCVEIQWQDSEGKDRFIIIDSGPKESFENGFNSAINSIFLNEKNTIDLLIVSHYDTDHIEGFLEFFKRKDIDFSKIKEIWFNSKQLVFEKPLSSYEAHFERIKEISTNLELGVGELISLTKKIEELKIKSNCFPITVETINEYDFDNLKLILISPFNENLQILFDSEPELTLSSKDIKAKSIEELWNLPNLSDSKKVHGASLSFILEHDGKRLLYLSDTSINVVYKRLLQLEDGINFDKIKLSHHGSIYNISKEFINYVNCSTYIISSDGLRHKHPHRETLAKIAFSNKEKGIPTEFIFNYPIHETIFSEEEKSKYQIKCTTSNEFHL